MSNLAGEVTHQSSLGFASPYSERQIDDHLTRPARLGIGVGNYNNFQVVQNT